MKKRKTPAIEDPVKPASTAELRREGRLARIAKALVSGATVTEIAEAEGIGPQGLSLPLAGFPAYRRLSAEVPMWTHRHQLLCTDSASYNLRAVLRKTAVLFMICLPVKAASEAVCNQYAQDAVNAQQQNLSSGCGLTGDPWSLNYGNHRSWCLGASQSSVDAEANARRAELMKCSRCTAYAQEAIEAQHKNITQSCSRAGDRWSYDYQNHRSWCMRSSQAAADTETNARRADLTKCNSCFLYAQRATAAQQQNVSNGCGLAGDKWSDNFNNHRSWCMGAAWSAIEGETNSRNAELGKCNSCSGYAQQATEAQQKNLANECGLNGDRWSSNFNGHKSWCIGAPQHAIDTETHIRKQEVDKCAGICRGYTLAALDAQRQNVSHGCNFTGSRWSLNAGDHMKWCLSAQQYAVEWETSERKKLINGCLTPGRKAACDSYAKRAIQQYETARNNPNCNRQDERRWHGNYQNHYGWCMAVNTAETATHSADRDRELARCASGPPPGKAGPPASEQCLVSVVIQNRTCRNLDGTTSTILEPGKLSATGCGSDAARARERAKLNLNGAGVCLSDDDDPEAGCCTYEEQVVAGCLCQ